jgi:hypothetical protein
MEGKASLSTEQHKAAMEAAQSNTCVIQTKLSLCSLLVLLAPAAAAATHQAYGGQGLSTQQRNSAMRPCKLDHVLYKPY